MQNHIIQFLKEAEGYVSGEDLSRQLKITRSAIWKNIEELRHQGYDIEAIPHHGYKLVSAPDKLSEHEIQYQLKTKILGKKIHCFENLSSTMDEALKLAMNQAPEGTIVCAETQSKGRGRMGRSWVSVKGKGIYFSLILRPKMTPTEVSKLTLLSAVSLCEAIEKSCGLRASIKWPNDLLVKGKKLAGILTELNTDMDRVRFVVLGVGLNVNTSSNLLPAHSTSIKNELNKTVSRVSLFQEILTALERNYLLVQAKGFDAVLKQWKAYSGTIGARVKIMDFSGSVEGQAIDLDADGCLVIRTDSGLAVKKITGDVIFV